MSGGPGQTKVVPAAAVGAGAPGCTPQPQPTPTPTSTRMYKYINEGSISGLLVCGVCGGPYVAPVMHSCGTILCEAHVVVDQLQVECILCGDVGARVSFKNHQLECKQLPAECPNGCGELVSPKNMPMHNGVCSCALLPCESPQCSWKGKRAQLGSHKESCPLVLLRPHLDVLNGKIESLSAQNEKLTREHAEFRATIASQNSKIESLNTLNSKLVHDLSVLEAKVDKLLELSKANVLQDLPKWQWDTSKLESSVRVEGDTCYRTASAGGVMAFLTSPLLPASSLKLEVTACGAFQFALVPQELCRKSPSIQDLPDQWNPQVALGVRMNWGSPDSPKFEYFDEVRVRFICHHGGQQGQRLASVIQSQWA
ncbi:hypothetical protein Pelo_6115 [Pelomyxa schiedti]|nr:hypothetical protein Pelo_6115 [Pelomyxa schiedti]